MLELACYIDYDSDSLGTTSALIAVTNRPATTPARTVVVATDRNPGSTTTHGLTSDAQLLFEMTIG